MKKNIIIFGIVMLMLVGNVNGKEYDISELKKSNEISGWDSFKVDEKLSLYAPVGFIEKSKIKSINPQTRTITLTDDTIIPSIPNQIQSGQNYELKKVLNGKTTKATVNSNGNGFIINQDGTSQFLSLGKVSGPTLSKEFTDQLTNLKNSDFDSIEIETGSVTFTNNNRKYKLTNTGGVETQFEVIVGKDNKELLKLEDGYIIKDQNGAKRYEKGEGEGKVTFIKRGDKFSQITIGKDTLPPAIAELVTDPSQIQGMNYDPKTNSGKFNNKPFRVDPRNNKQYILGSTLYLEQKRKEDGKDIFIFELNNDNSEILNLFDFSKWNNRYEIEKVHENGLAIKSGDKYIEVIEMNDGKAKSRTRFTNKKNPTTFTRETYKEKFNGKNEGTTTATYEYINKVKTTKSQTSIYYTNKGDYVRRESVIKDGKAKKDFTEYNIKFKPTKVVVDEQTAIVQPDGTITCKDPCDEAKKVAKAKRKYASLGSSWNHALESVQSAKGILNFFDVKVKAFEGVQNFFNNNALGQIFTGNLEDALVCNKHIKRSQSQGTLITPFTDYGRIIAPIAAHAEGEKTKLKISCESNSNCTQYNAQCNSIGFCEKDNTILEQFLYKITYVLDAQTQRMNAEINLKGNQTIRLLNPTEMEKGNKLKRLGTDAILKKSQKEFNEICITIRARQGGTFCNEIISTENKEILKDVEVRKTIPAIERTRENLNW